MALAVDNYSEQTGSTNPLVLTKPNGVASGDLLLIFVGNDDNTATQQWSNSSSQKPAGFTFITEAGNDTADVHTAAFWRLASATEGATITAPCSTLTAGNDFWGAYVRVTGAKATTPINQTGSAVVTGATTSVDVTGVTTNTTECMGFFVLSNDEGRDVNAFTVSNSGWTETEEIATSTAAAGMSGVWGTKTLSGAGPTGTVTVESVSPGEGWAGFQFAVAPSTGAAGVTQYSYTLTKTFV